MPSTHGVHARTWHGVQYSAFWNTGISLCIVSKASLAIP